MLSIGWLSSAEMMAVKLFVLVMTLAEKGQGSLTRSSLVVTCTLGMMLAKEASSSLVRS